jgi:L-threonylcarbamoyladenylate synthase
MPLIAEPNDRAIDDAVARLRAGQPVAFPTETVYGLGVNLLDADAIIHVFELKGRDPTNPLIAHVAAAVQARSIVTDWDQRAEKLARAFWPGPLTMVLPRAEHVPAVATAGLPSVAVRCPRHPVAARLLHRFAGAIAAPSANRSGHVSPTTARHVADDFADEPTLLILDGGPCRVGIESTVLDLTADEPRILRPGSVSGLEIEQVLGEPVRAPAIRGQDASPGTSLAHYAPRTPAVLVERDAIGSHLEKSSAPLVVLCFDRELVPPPHRAIVMPQGAGDYGRVLYDALRRADDLGRDQILIERPPTTNEMWKTVADRLRRATS